MNLIYPSCQGVRLVASAIALVATLAQTAALAQAVGNGPVDLTKAVVRNAAADVRVTEWGVDQASKTAFVQAKSSPGSIYAGVQCDPFDDRGRRLILGAVRSVDQDGLLAEMRATRPTKLSVTVGTESTHSHFSTYAEDRGNLELGVPVEYAAAYLSVEQYALLKAAKHFTISNGRHTYAFTGRGSSGSIGSLTCDSRKMTVASRTMPARRDEPPRPVQTPWQFIAHTGTAALVKGSYEASTTIANFPNNELASFRLRVSCQDGRLFAAFSGGEVARSVDDPRTVPANAFVQSINNRPNLATVYRGQARIAAIPVDGADQSWKGHLLSYDEITALFEFDRIVVNGGDRAIEFGAKNAGPTIVAVAQACGANG